MSEPIVDLSYRGYDGPHLAERQRWLVIAKMGWRIAFKKKAFWVFSGIAGWYYLVMGMGMLPASLLFGAVWQCFGASAAFFLSAGISTCACFGLFVFLKLVPSQKMPLSFPQPKTSDE